MLDFIVILAGVVTLSAVISSMVMAGLMVALGEGQDAVLPSMITSLVAFFVSIATFYILL